MKLRMLGNQLNKGCTPWNKGKQGVQVVTEETRRKLSLVKRGNTNAKGKRSLEVLKRWILTRPRGENHYAWKGGVTKDKRVGTKYAQWRSQVFERDNYICQGCYTRGGYLEAHHVKAWASYPELRYDLANGSTLCRDCHKLTDNYKGKNRGLPIHNCDQENNEDGEADTGSAGGDISEQDNIDTPVSDTPSAE